MVDDYEIREYMLILELEIITITTTTKNCFFLLLILRPHIKHFDSTQCQQQIRRAYNRDLNVERAKRDEANGKSDEEIFFNTLFDHFLYKYTMNWHFEWYICSLHRFQFSYFYSVILIFVLLSEESWKENVCVCVFAQLNSLWSDSFNRRN